MKIKLLNKSIIMILLVSLFYEKGNAQIIGAGNYQSFVICSSGTLKAFGYNGYGELGDNTYTSTPTPVALNGFTGVIAIEGGNYHTIALKSDGTVWTWGYNSNGEIGDSTISLYSYLNNPVQVPGLSGIVAIAAGNASSYAVKSDGTVWAWGYNGDGELGDSTYTDRNYPVKVVGLSGITKVKAGDYHALALKGNGTVWAWGSNGNGQLGDGTTIQRNYPIQVSSISGITALCGGNAHSLFLKNNGTVWACGYNGYGQLGIGNYTDQDSPVQISTISGITAIASMGYHSNAVKNDGTLWSWGDNGYGQSGDGTINQYNYPELITSISNIIALADGYLHTVAIQSDGTFWAWGYNAHGELGDGNYNYQYLPVKVHDCCTNLPAITIPSSCIAMDTTVQSAHSSKTFKLYNTACGSLIVSSVTSSNTAFTVSPPTDTITAYDSATVTIMFSPTVIGSNSAALTIHNNAHDTTVCVSGYCTAIPTVSVAPPSFNVTLGCNSSSTSILSIGNTGAGNLTFQVSKQQIKAALVAAEPYYISTVQAQLMATGKFSGVDIYDASSITPSLAQLQQYDAVLVWDDYSYADATTLGDNLANYIDGGGGVVTAMWSVEYGDIGGRFSSGNYFCIDPPGNYTTGDATLGTVYNSNSPILQNIASFDGGSNSYRAYTFSADPLATRVADWSDGIPLIATRNINSTNRVDLNFWPADNLSVSAYLLMANALAYSAGKSGWVSASRTSGYLAAGNSVNDTIHFNSAGLIAGTYTNSIVVTSNDPNTPTVTVPCTLHVVGNAKMNVTLFNSATSCLNLDSIMAFTTSLDSIAVSNSGCDTLRIISLNASPSQYSVISSPTNIAPGASQNFVVKFSPVTSGTFTGTLTIHTNISDTTICLSAKAFPQPNITVTPNPLTVTLGCGDTLLSTMVIGNSGAGNLSYQIAGGGNSKIKIALVAADYSNYATDVQTKLMATGNFSLIDIYQANNMTPTLAQLQQYDAVLVWANYGFNDATTIGNNLADYIDGGGGVVTAMWALSSYCPIYGRYNTGNYWCIDNSGGDVTGQQSLGTIYNHSSPILANVTSFNGGSYSWRPNTHSVDPLATRVADWSDGTPLIATRVIHGTNRVDLGFWPPSNDVYSGNWLPSTDGARIMANALRYSANRTNWMTLSPTSGTVASGNSSNITFDFSAKGLNAGVYSTPVTITSNDPNNLSIVVPVTMNIVGNPHMNVSLFNTTLPCLNLDSIMAFTISTDSLQIKNTGCDTLRINSYTVSPSAYSVVSYPAYIAQGASKNLVIKFSPSAAGTFSGTLSLYTNAIDTAICLIGKAFPQPTISTAPTSFNVNLGCSDSLTTSLTINNTGGGTLNYNIVNPNLPVAASCAPQTTSTCCAMGIYNVTFNTINNSTGDATQGYQDYTGTQSTILVPGNTYTLSVQTGPTYTEYVSAWIDYNNNGIFEAGEQIMNANSSFNVHTINVTIPLNAGANGAMRMRVGSEYYYQSAPQPCTNVIYGQFEDYTIRTSSNSVYISSYSGSLISNSSNNINVQFSSVGLNAGTYSGNITINSNDPVHNPLLVPYTVNVSGSGIIGLTKNCLNLDSIMQNTTHSDSLYVKNSGCDTLKVSSITHHTNIFSVISSAFNVLPGDSVKLITTFAPVAAGNFTDTLNILNNNITQKVCLSGKAFPNPIITTNPTSFNVTLACCDSSILPLTINNIGGSNLISSIKNLGGGNAKPKVLILTSGDAGTTAQTALISTGRFTLSDIDILVSPNPFTMAMLAPYNAVLVWTDNTFGSTMVGDTLKKFADNGGGVIIGTYAFNTNWGMTGGIMGANYSPFPLSGSTQCVSGTINLTTLPYPNHPIFKNVNVNPTYWTNCNYYNPVLNPGATLLAQDLNGNNVVAENHNGKVIGMVIFPNNLNSANAATDMMFANALYYVNNNSSWLTLTPSADTTASGGSSTVNVKFKSCGLLTGVYSTNIIINSNDPLKPIDSIHCTLNVTGTGIISLSKNCENLDSIMQYTTHKDSLYVKNTGCDTLKISNITHQTSIFTANTTSFNVLPSDSVKLITTFAPVSIGTFTDTLTILNNNVTQKVCLSGKAFARPIISTSPTSLSATLSCVDSSTTTLTINNTGGSPLNYNINLLNLTMNSNLPSAALCAPATTGTCCGMGVYNVSFGSINNSTGSAVQGYQDYSASQSTVVIPGQIYSLSVQTGTTYPENVRVWIDFNDDGVFDAGEMVMSDLNTLPNTLHNATLTIPTSAVKNKAVRMRVGSEYYYYAAPQPCTNVTYGQFEDYTVKIASWVALSNVSGSVSAGSSNSIIINFNSTNLNVGTNTASISISSNDPLNNPLLIPCSVTVVGAGKIGLSKTCMYLDSIMQYTSHTDSLYFRNTGCDTLKITNITTQTNIYTVNATSFNILPGDSAKLYTTFSPVAIGTFLDTLTILNNDITKKVCLSGKCFQRPILSADPNSFNITLSCTDSIIDTLRISNTGGSNLIYQLSGAGTKKIKVALIGADYSNYLTDVQNKLMATGRFTLIDTYLGNNVTPTLTQLQQYDAVLVWGDYNFANATQLGNNLADYVDSGGGLVSGVFAVGGTTPISGRYNSGHYWCINQTSGNTSGGPQTLGTIYQTNSPILKNVHSFNGGTSSYRANTFSIDASATRIADWSDGRPLIATKIIGNSRVVDLSFWPPSNDVYSGNWLPSTDGATLMANALFYSANVGVSWMAIHPAADTTLAGNTSNILIGFNSSGLTVGNYSASIAISSNDPLNLFDTIPVSLHVIGNPKIRVSENCLNLDSIMVYTSFADSSLYVKNTGCDTLKITNITHQLSVYSVSPTTFNILPGDSAKVKVLFSPTTVGTFKDTLTILNNNVTQKVCLSGKGYPRPIQCHSPNSYNVHFTICQDSIIKPITVCNTNGGSNLYWNLNTENKSAAFDGSIGSYVQLPNNLIHDHLVLTLELWFKTTSYGIIFGYQDSSYPSGPGNYVPILYVGVDGLLRGGYWGAGTITSSAIVNDGNWHQVALVGNVNSNNLYLDGNLVGTSFGTINHLGMSFNQIGGGYYPGWASSSGGWNTFNGNIDEVRLYDIAKTQIQIQNSMSIGLNGNEAGLMGYWNFDNGTATDLTNFHNNGIFNGNAVTAIPGAPIVPIALGNSIVDTTVAGGAKTINITFKKSGFTSGIHYYNIYLTSNDPLNTVDTIPVTMTVDSIPPTPPVSNNINVCFGYSVPPFIATANSGDTIKWFNSSMVLQHVGSSYNTGQTAVGVYTYYVTSTDSINGCQSRKDSVQLHINAAPTKPVATDISACFGSTIPPLTSTGTIQKWYSNSNLSNLLFVGNPYNTGMTAAGTYTYYVADSTAGCPKSISDTVSLIIHSIPSKPIVNNVSACFGGTIPSFSATGTGSDTIKWYSSSLSQLHIGNTYSTGLTSPGTYTYYVTQTDSLLGCASPKDTATLTIHFTPQPTANSQTSCFGSSTSTLTATGTNLRWYSANMTFLYAGNPYNTGLTAVGVDTFYVTQTLNNCESSAKRVILTINPLPSAPTSANVKICFGQSTPALTATGTNVSWYSNPALTTLVHNGNTYNTGLTSVGNYIYYVTQSALGCSSPADTVHLNIGALPSRPITNDANSCFGNPTPNLVASSTGSDTVKWYSNSSLTNLVFTGNPYNTGNTSVGTYTYYITQTDSASGCVSKPDTSALVINSAPVKPTSNDVVSCFGQTIAPLTSTGSIIHWYSNPSLTTLVYAGNPYNTGNTAVGTYTYYLTDSTVGCPVSPPDTVTLTINPIPVSPTTSGNVSICFGQANPSLSATGTNVNWYSDVALTTLVHTGSPFTPAQTAAGIYNFYVTQTVNGCSSAASNVVFTIHLTPPVSVSNINVVVGTTVPDFTVVGSNIIWYDSTGTLTATGNTFATGQTAIGQYTYYVTQTLNGCESAKDTVKLTIRPLAPVSSNVAVCFGNTIPDLTTSTGVNINWYSNSGLSNLVHSGSIFATGNTSVGTYTYYVTQTVNGIQSSPTTVTLTINAIPAAPIANNQSTCFGGVIPNLTATGSAIQWYSGTSVISSGSSFATGNTAVGVYPYTVTQTVSGCESPSKADTLTINSLPSKLVASNVSSCFGSSTPDITATGTNIKWYSTAPSLVGSGSPFASGKTLPGTYTYLVTQTSALTGCESPFDTATVTINFTTRPVTSNVSVCAGTVVPALTATGTNIQWYDSAFAAVHSGSPFNTGQTAIGIHTYYVTQTNSTTGCESLKDTVTLAINALPSAPVSSNATVCFGQTTPGLVATGTNVNWYNNQTLSTVLFNGNTYNTGNTTVGVYTYYFTQTVSGCQSPADSVTLTINPTPAAPVTSGNVAICFGQANPTLSATGSDINWYSDVTLTTLAGTGSTLTPTQTVAGTYTYYVTQITNGCVSPASSITFTIHFTPAVHVNNVSIPFGTATPDLVAVGTNIIWYDSAMVNVFTNNTFSTGITAIGAYTYYVTQTLNNCESAKDTVVLTIYPSSPVSSNQSICFGTATPDLSATGNNIRWYSDSLLTHLVYSGNPFTTGNTAVGAYNYFVTQTVNNVQSPYTNVTITINAIPNAPAVVNKSACLGGTIPDLTATGASIQWYSASTVVHSGNTFTTGNTSAGVYGYSVTQTANGCESPAAADTLTINSLPATPVASPVTTCFGNPVPDLTATGTNIIWHDTTGTVVHNGSSFTTGITVPGTYTYYVYELNTLTGCQSHPDTTTLKINYTAPPAAANVSICRGTTVPPLTATGTNIQWYDTSALLFSGNSFVTGDTAVGVYSYYVTQTNSVTGCQSKADTVKLSINTAPGAPSGTDASVCSGGTVPSLTSSGTNVNWYSSAALGSSLFNGNTYNTGMTAVGTYTYYITQTAGGCAGPASTVTLTINSIPAMPSTSGNASICFGQANPTFTATGTNINWYSNQNLTTLVQSGNSYISTQTAAGSYTYYVTQNNLSTGCASLPDSLKFIIHSLPTVSASSSAQSVCNGSSLTLTGSGATSYSWTGGVTNGVAFVPVSSGSYTVTGTDINSCTNTSSVSVVVNPLPVLSNTVTATCAGTCNGAASVSLSGGTPGYTYLWTGGFTSSTLSNLCSGNYSVTGTDGNGCQATASISVTANPLPMVTASASSASICSGFTDTLHAGGATSYTWSGGVTNGVSFSPSSTSTYTVTGTDNNGCTNTASVTVTVNPLPTILANATATSICNGIPVMLTGSGGTSYSWTGGVTNGVSFVPASTGTYTVTGTDSHGCVNTNSVTVSVNSLPTITANASATTVCSGTSVTLTGGGAVSYSWTGGIADNVAFVPASSQTYTVTGTVGTNCSNTSTISITVNSLPVVTASATSASICTGSSDILNGGGATSYVWSGGVTNGVSFSPASTATYTVTGSDNNSCTNTASVTVTVNPLPTIIANATSTTLCAGASTTLTGSGGATYTWTGGVTDAVSFAPTFTGSYTVTGTDNNGCTNTDTITVSVNPLPTVIANATATDVCAGTSVILHGIGAITYTWNNGVTDSVSFVPASTANYIVTGTNGNGCSDTTSVSIIVRPLPVIAINSSATAVCAGTSALINGTGAVSYNWSGGITDSVSFVPAITATYTLTGTGSNGCDATDSITITVNPLPAKPIALDTNVCSLATIPNLTATGTNVHWYNTSNVNVYNGNSFATGQTAVGTYTYYVTQSNTVTGCVSPADTSVLVIMTSPPVPVANDVAVCFGNPVTTIYSTGINVSWYSNAALTNLVHTGNSYNNGQTAVGAYTYYVVDSLPGCRSSVADMVTLTINAAPSVPVVNNVTVCYGGNAMLSATGVNPHWYSDFTLINLLATGNNFTPSQTGVGNYIYYVVDFAAGCGNSRSDTVHLDINPKPLVTTNVTAISIPGGSSTTLTAYNANTYSWAPAAGLNTTSGVTVTAAPAVTTTYTVTGTNADGCSNTATVVVTISTGINEVDAALADLNIYPNPAIDQFTIEFSSSLNTQIEIYLFNSIGQKLWVASPDGAAGQGLKKHRYDVNTTSLDAGVYSIEIVTTQGTITRRLVLIK